MSPLRSGAITAMLFAGVAASAFAQENMTSPPAPLPWPAVELDTTLPTTIAFTALRRAIEQNTDLELCRQRMVRNHETVPPMFMWPLCPQVHKDAIAARQGLVAWKEGARPTECGTNCVGRPNLAQSTYTNRPNVSYTMFYGHLDFVIDTTFDRDVTYFYEAQLHCVMDPDRRSGALEVRMFFGQPVVGDPGLLESVLDFALPFNISRSVESAMRAGLSSVAPSTDSTGYRCVSVGPRRSSNPGDDDILFRKPASSSVHPLPTAAGLGQLATVHFLGVTRKPPAFGYTPLAESGSFSVYLNGELVTFPELPELQLPFSGGSTALNLCRTINLHGADRLQVIFANSYGGGVWSQFAESQHFGAGIAHRMTTSRTVMVAGQQQLPGQPPLPPSANRPHPVVLREYELLYSIDYSPAPADVGVARPPTGRPGRGERPPTNPTRVLDTGRGAGAACRQI